MYFQLVRGVFCAATVQFLLVKSSFAAPSKAPSEKLDKSIDTRLVLHLNKLSSYVTNSLNTGPRLIAYGSVQTKLIAQPLLQMSFN